MRLKLQINWVFSITLYNIKSCIIYKVVTQIDRYISMCIDIFIPQSLTKVVKAAFNAFNIQQLSHQVSSSLCWASLLRQLLISLAASGSRCKRHSKGGGKGVYNPLSRPQLFQLPLCCSSLWAMAGLGCNESSQMLESYAGWGLLTWAFDVTCHFWLLVARGEMCTSFSQALDVPTF